MGYDVIVPFQHERRPDFSARPCGSPDSDFSAQLVCWFRIFRAVDLADQPDAGSDDLTDIRPAQVFHSAADTEYGSSLLIVWTEAIVLTVLFDSIAAGLGGMCLSLSLGVAMFILAGIALVGFMAVRIWRWWMHG